MALEHLRVLELNADFIPLHLVPLSTITWQQAFKKIFEDVAYPLSYYDNEFVHTQHETFKVPSVIIMRDYKKFNKHAKYSKYNVKLRDGFHCQYCNKRFSARALTIDHVDAKSKGGRLTWENSVAACKPCNNEKKHYEAQIPMKFIPIRIPYRPDYLELAQKMVMEKGITDERWKPYLSFLEKKNKT